MGLFMGIYCLRLRNRLLPPWRGFYNYYLCMYYVFGIYMYIFIHSSTLIVFLASPAA